MLLRRESICHTALLPSRSRLEGITTNSDVVGDELGGFETGYNEFLMTSPEGVLHLAFNMTIGNIVNYSRLIIKASF